MTSSGFQPGDVVSGYRIEGVLGRGGMGVVYRVADPSLPRSDALKILDGALSLDSMFRARFEREADTAAILDHPNIVAVYARGQTEGGQLWIAMQYVPGTDAGEVLHTGTMTPERAVRIITEVARALDYAHRRNIMHRDIKPANFLLAPDEHDHDEERVFLADFGIARALDDAVHLTTDGNVMASVAYASPETLSGTDVDHRADIYSLGCSLYTLLTGKSPYAGLPGMAAIANAHLQAPPPRPTDVVPGLPPAINAVIAKAMAKNPAERYQTARELAEAATMALNDATTALPRSTVTQQWASAPPRPPGTTSGPNGPAHTSGPQPVPYPPTGPNPAYAQTQPRGLAGPGVPPGPPFPPNGTSRPVAPPNGSGGDPAAAKRKRRLVIAGSITGVLVLVGAMVALFLNLGPSTQPYTAQTFTHVHGSTEIKTAPTAIAALGPGDADAVLSLGLQPVVIGGVKAKLPSWLQDKVKGEPPTMNFVDTDTVKSAHPDVIIATGDIDDATYQRLAAIAPTITRPSDTTVVWNWQTQLQWIAKIVGRDRDATPLISQVGTQLTDLKNQNSKLVGKTVTVLNFADDGMTQTLTPSNAADYLSALGLNYDNTLQRTSNDKTSTRPLADAARLYASKADLVIVVRTDHAAGGGGQAGLPLALTANPGLVVVDDPDTVAALADPGGFLATEFLNGHLIPVLATAG